MATIYSLLLETDDSNIWISAKALQEHLHFDELVQLQRSDFESLYTVAGTVEANDLSEINGVLSEGSPEQQLPESVDRISVGDIVEFEGDCYIRGLNDWNRIRLID